MKMTFQEIRIIGTGPCITNQLRDVNTICRRSWYIAAHIWKIYDFKIEVVPFIIHFKVRYCQSDLWVKPVGIQKDEIGKRSFLKLSFANKGLDAFSLGNILNHKSVNFKRIPPYFKDQSTHEWETCTGAIMWFRLEIVNIEILQHVLVI